MLRTRSAILDGAERCLERQGVRGTTMGDIAATGKVAKATLYNHFRAKGDVLAGLVETRAATLAQECEERAAADGLAAALAQAAGVLASSRVLRRVASEEPALLVPLAAPGEGPGWEQVRAAVAAVLGTGGAPDGPGEVELVLRWLLSQLLWPATPEAAAAGAAAVARAAQGASSVPSQGRVPDEPGAAGLAGPADLTD